MASFEHRLQQFDPGVIWLDSHYHVTGMNAVAGRVLGVSADQAIGREVLQLHPEKSREKIAWLLQSAHGEAGCPVQSPPPMTMMINIPDRVLLIKLSRILGSAGETVGSCLVFFDLTDVISDEPATSDGVAGQRLLRKLPVYKHQRVMLLDLEDVVHLKAGGHYTEAFVGGESYLCNLSLSDLENRLDPTFFMRVHRSHMVNLDHAAALEKNNEQYLLVMTGMTEQPVPVSRNRVGRLKNLFGLA